MTNKQREEVRKTSKSLGSQVSAYDPHRETLKGTNIIHIDDNRTKIGNNIYYGETAAKEAIKKLGS